MFLFFSSISSPFLFFLFDITSNISIYINLSFVSTSILFVASVNTIFTSFYHILVLILVFFYLYKYIIKYLPLYY